MELEKNCGSCKFFCDNGSSSNGHCHVNPPVLFLHTKQTNKLKFESLGSFYPIVEKVSIPCRFFIMAMSKMGIIFPLAKKNEKDD